MQPCKPDLTKLIQEDLSVRLLEHAEAHIVLDRPLGRKKPSCKRSYHGLNGPDYVFVSCLTMYMNGLTENVQLPQWLRNSTLPCGQVIT